ncbi:MAG: sigma-70 family RNA polymerase sigma factor [Colwellia sp.]|nr:sigma-70 family RNA polymerase sigma factor [Colwellia sp.]
MNPAIEVVAVEQHDLIATNQHLLAWYQAHHGWLFSWLNRRISCHAQAADLTQDTFERLLKKPVKQPIVEPRAYLTRIAQGLMIDGLRRSKLEQRYREQIQQFPQEYQPDPEQQLALLQTLMQIDLMLDGLKPKVRQVFLMSRLDGLTYLAIAEQLAISLSSVEKYMAKAMLHCYKARF